MFAYSQTDLLLKKTFELYNFQVYTSIISLVAGKRINVQQEIEKPIIQIFKHCNGKTLDSLVTGKDRMNGLRWEKVRALFKGIF